MNEILFFIFGLLVGISIGWFLSGLGWMKAIDEDEKQKHPERYH